MKKEFYEDYYISNNKENLKNNEVYLYVSTFFPFYIENKDTKVRLKSSFQKQEKDFFSSAIQINDYFYTNVINSLDDNIDVYRYKEKIEIEVEWEKQDLIEQINPKVKNYAILNVKSASRDEIYFFHLDIEFKVKLSKSVKSIKLEELEILKEISTNFDNAYKKYYEINKEEKFSIKIKKGNQEVDIFKKEKEIVREYLEGEFNTYKNKKIKVKYIFNRKAFNYTSYFFNNSDNNTDYPNITRSNDAIKGSFKNYNVKIRPNSSKFELVKKRQIFHSTYKIIFLISIIQKSMLWRLHNVVSGSKEDTNMFKIRDFIMLSENFMFLDVAPEDRANDIYKQMRESFGIETAVLEVEKFIDKLIYKQSEEATKQVNNSVHNLTYFAIGISIFSLTVSIPSLFATSFTNFLQLPKEGLPNLSEVIIWYGRCGVALKFILALILTIILMSILIFIEKSICFLKTKFLLK